MPLLAVRFNMGNFLFLPLIIGIAVGNGVHIVHRFRMTERHAREKLPLPRSTGKAITCRC